MTTALRPGEKKAPGRPYSDLPVHKEGLQKSLEGLFFKECSDRTRSDLN